ncbi:GNAT family N-acetyltransferase [Bacillaceae bacterium W0354]
MEITDIVELSDANLETEGCYCLRSKPKSNGYINKNNWLIERFNEGLKYIKIFDGDKVAGFIEYVPIEHSSRVVYGKNYIVIHCLWVHITGKGYASQLIEKCIEDAKEQNKNGVIVVTNDSTSWTPSKDIFLKHDFQHIDNAPYGFELLVHKFGNATNPYFPNDWNERLARFEDLTILRTRQCPFVDIATNNVVHGAKRLGIEVNIIDINNRDELMKLSPTPYGIYAVIFKQQLISYHRLTVHSAFKRLRELN